MSGPVQAQKRFCPGGADTAEIQTDFSPPTSVVDAVAAPGGERADGSPATKSFDFNCPKLLTCLSAQVRSFACAKFDFCVRQTAHRGGGRSGRRSQSQPDVLKSLLQ